MPSKMTDLAIYTWYDVPKADDEPVKTFSVPATTRDGARRKARAEIAAAFPEGEDEATDNTRRHYLKLVQDEEPIRNGFLIA